MTQKSEKWTLEEVQKNLEINCSDYGAAVSIAALYKKIYGNFPKIGLSGFQAECATVLIEKLPTPEMEVTNG